MGQPAVLYHQVERVGAVQVDLGLEQSTVRCRWGSAETPARCPLWCFTQYTHLPLTSARLRV